jgi:hypothetical protein
VTAIPVRTPSGPNHLCTPTGRGYLTACGTTLRGANLVVPRRMLWAKVWALERACKKCEAKAARARNDRELAALAGWR